MRKILKNKNKTTVLQIEIIVKLFNEKDKMIENLKCFSKTSILKKLQGKKFKKGLLRVTYEPNYWNEAEFTNIKEFKYWLTVFMEEDLINYISSTKRRRPNAFFFFLLSFSF